MTELRAILFDVDGTLANTEHQGHRKAFNLAFEEAGYDWHWDQPLYARLLEVTGGRERLVHFLNDHPLRETDKERIAAKLHLRKNQFYKSLVSQGAIPLRPGIERLFAEILASDVRLVIVSTSGQENILALIRGSFSREVESGIELIVAGESVEKKKPSPDAYLLALDKLKLRADQCLAVEDSEAGLAAANAAGIATLITWNDYTRGQNFEGACAVLENLEHGVGGSPVDLNTLVMLHRNYLKELA